MIMMKRLIFFIILLFLLIAQVEAVEVNVSFIDILFDIITILTSFVAFFYMFVAYSNLGGGLREGFGLFIIGIILMVVNTIFTAIIKFIFKDSVDITLIRKLLIMISLVIFVFASKKISDTILHVSK